MPSGSRHVSSLSSESIFPKDDPFASTVMQPVVTAPSRLGLHRPCDSTSTLVTLHTIEEALPSYKYYTHYRHPSHHSTSVPDASIPTIPSTHRPSSSRSRAVSLETLRGVEESGMTSAWWSPNGTQAELHDVHESPIAPPEAAHVHTRSRTASISSGSWH